MNSIHASVSPAAGKSGRESPNPAKRSSGGGLPRAAIVAKHARGGGRAVYIDAYMYWILELGLLELEAHDALQHNNSQNRQTRNNAILRGTPLSLPRS